MDEQYIATEKCKTCIFKGLCQSAQLEHCEDEWYVEEVK